MRRHWTLWLTCWAVLFCPFNIPFPTGWDGHFVDSVRADDVRLTMGFEPVSGDEQFLPDEEPPFLDAAKRFVPDECSNGNGADFGYHILPAGLMYRSYIAGEKEPRFQSVWLHETGRGLVWEPQLGGRFGVLRYGTDDAVNPQGWQLDVEGGAQVRIDPQQHSDVEAADFRFGLLSTWRFGPNAFKAGYYHISSHIGDEFLIRNPGFLRLNYVRDSAIIGWTQDVTPDMQIYGEIGYAAGHEGGAKPLEFQYGFQYTPLRAYGFHGAPYFAVNGHTREDNNWISSINTVAGWQWRGEQTNHLFRLGVQYYTGPAIQYSFVGRNETLCGAGLWFDY